MSDVANRAEYPMKSSSGRSCGASIMSSTLTHTDAANALRLVDIRRTQEDSLPFERRREHRNTLSEQVTAVQSERLGDHRHRIRSLELRNISDGGLGAWCSEPIETGVPIAVYFPSHGADTGFDLYGHVVRCDNCDGRHDVGIRFDHRAAA
jgi:hypothetical protein